MTEQPDPAVHGQQGALEALLEVVAATSKKEYGIAIDSFEDGDYEELIRLAWRHQFEEDRSRFKREVRQLQEHVSARILDRLELQQ